MTDVQIIDIPGLEGPRISVISPFSPEMPPKARELGGRWDRQRSAWIFDARDRERVAELLRSIYGTDGTQDTAAATVTVRVRLYDYEDGKTARFAGRRIAERPSRDADVRLSKGVVLVEGYLPGRGGSVANPRIDAPKDVVVEIRDLPHGALSVEDEDSYEIVDQAVDTTALRAERARLLARLTEIDAALAAAGEAVEESK